MPLKKQRGFTLIELLIVIAIIALLAAILFPVFARARENARKSSCASNVKQVSMGVAQYVQDYDERFPAYLRAGAYLPAQLEPYVKSKQVWKCPSSVWLDDEWDGTAADWQTTYGINLQLSEPSYLGLSLAAVNKTAETVMFVEANYLGTGGACVADPIHANSGRPIARHLGLLNVSFVDGHVKAMLKENVEKTDTTEEGAALSGDAVSILWNKQ